jgi:pimeloyl-ACP methyl ester carboxylesterase
MRTNNIVLIHGLWMTPSSFEGWTDHFLERGFNVYAPAWPGMDRDIRALRRDPHSFARSGIRPRIDIHKIVDLYERLVLELDSPPIIIGHCLGGLVAQALVGRGLGSCGIALAPVPPKGVWRMPWATLRVVAPRLLARNGTGIALTPRQFHYAFMNASRREESDCAYQRYAVPADTQLLLQAGFANFDPYAQTVDVRRHKRPPLLLVAGERDRFVTPSVVRANHRLYRKSSAITEYREFAGRTHFLIGQDGWREIADHALEWARGQQLLHERERRRIARELQARRVA